MTQSKVHLKLADELKHQALVLEGLGFFMDAYEVHRIASRVEKNEKVYPDTPLEDLCAAPETD